MDTELEDDQWYQQEAERLTAQEPERAIYHLGIGNQARIRTGWTNIWICGQHELTAEWLDTFHQNPMLINCKDKRTEEIDQLCESRGMEQPYLWTFGHHKWRKQFFGRIMSLWEEYHYKGIDMVQTMTYMGSN